MIEVALNRLRHARKYALTADSDAEQAQEAVVDATADLLEAMAERLLLSEAIVIDGVVELEATEDHGRAFIAEVKPDNDALDGMFVRLHSWSESGDNHHQELRALLDKRVRITIEVAP